MRYGYIMENQLKSTPRDVFMYLLVTATLYTSVVSFIALLFAYVDALYPDQLNFCFGCGLDQIRWSSSILIVVFPVFLFIFGRLRKEYVKMPEKREIKARKWLVYLTLFLAAVTIIADLVAIIFNFYSGELTARFFLKTVVVLAVAAAVFWYYLWDIKKESVDSKKTKTIVWVTSLVVLAALAGGFFIVGSPAQQRERRFDERRVSDLQSIQSAIIYEYYQNKQKLPVRLDDLKNDITGFTPPVDPQTGRSYEYRVTGTLSFELCADFKASSQDGGTVGRGKYPEPAIERGPFLQGQQNWQHGSGQVCFSRTIDPDFFKPSAPAR